MADAGGTMDKRRKLAVEITRYLLDQKVNVVQTAHNKKDIIAQQILSRDTGAAVPRACGAMDFMELAVGDDTVISWRVHAVMAALSLGVPCLIT